MHVDNGGLTMGSIEYIMAPLAGYTDVPFRRMCWRHGLDRGHTALIDAGALVYGNKENPTILARCPEDRWLAAQLMGSRLDLLEKAAPMLNAMDYDAIDFNMGCPVKKVVQRHAGAALLKMPEHALECVKLLRDLIAKPLTVKLRILDEANPEPTLALCQKLEEVGVEGITIHGRLASRIYSGPVAFLVIRAVREGLRIPVTANGGIVDVATCRALHEGTGCDRLMVARGAIGNPWIFKSLKEGVDYRPSHQELCETLREHLSGMVSEYGEAAGLVNGRKIILAYMGGRGYRRSLKAGVCQISTWSEFLNFMELLEQDQPNLS